MAGKQLDLAGKRSWLNGWVRFSETIVFMTRTALRGTKAFKQRQGMEFWYAERRNDPGGDCCAPVLRGAIAQ